MPPAAAALPRSPESAGIALRPASLGWPADGPGTLSATAERARRRVVLGITAIYLLALLEGALRKWVAPQLGAYLFFLRDPVLLVVYLLATQHALWPRQSLLLRASGVIAVLGALLLVLQAATGGASDHRVLLGVYGWRSYCLYLPLAPLIAAVFRPDDLQRFLRLTLWLGLPIGLLVAAQFFSPPGAPINVGTADDAAYQFRGLSQTFERTRPMGPFASGAGQQQFVAASFAALIAGFVASRGAGRPGVATLGVGAAGLLTCIALSGSRGTVLQCALAVLAAMGVGLIGRGVGLKGRALLWPVGLSVVALIAYPLVFPEGYAALTERWTAAGRVEAQSFGDSGVLGRALYGLIDFVDLFDQVPVLGYGLGFGGNASITLGASVDGVMPGYLAETDYSRHMVDLGPLFGMGYIVFRLVLAAWLIARALRATRLHADPLPLTLLSYVAVLVLSGQITGQGTINLFCWLYVGLLMAACQPPNGGRAQLPRRAGVVDDDVSPAAGGRAWPVGSPRVQAVATPRDSGRRPALRGDRAVDRGATRLAPRELTDGRGRRATTETPHRGPPSPFDRRRP